MLMLMRKLVQKVRKPIFVINFIFLCVTILPAYKCLFSYPLIAFQYHKFGTEFPKWHNYNCWHVIFLHSFACVSIHNKTIPTECWASSSDLVYVCMYNALQMHQNAIKPKTKPFLKWTSRMTITYMQTITTKQLLCLDTHNTKICFRYRKDDTYSL